MERSLFGFIIRYSKRDQLLIVPLVVGTMVVYYLSLDLPKTIINQAIQGDKFQQPGATAGFLGLELGRIEYLFALSLVFLALIVLNGWLKFQINTMKGWMGERMLRRLRFQLYDLILRFPLTRFRRVKAAEMATMIKDEVEPLGGFIGEALITPLFLGGQALTAMFFIMYQHWALGLVALAVVAIQAVVIPKLRQRLLVLGRERDQAERPVLVEDEEHRGQRLPAEEERRDQRLADEAAQRLDLVLDHGRHLRGLDAAEARDREAQDGVVEREAQAAQHALAHPALHRVDLELEPAIEHDQPEEDQRQGEQVLQAREIEAEEAGGGVGLRKLAALDRLVDDRLRQVERQVVHDHGADHQRHDQQLVALAVADDEAEKAAVH